MAQAKKKTTSVKKAPASKSSAKSAAVKQKATVKVRSSTKKTTPQGYKTLKRSKAEQPFFSVKLTSQTLYWLILGVIVLALGSWIINLQVKVNSIYDKIDESQLYYDQINDIDSRVHENKKAIDQNSKQ